MERPCTIKVTHKHTHTRNRVDFICIPSYINSFIHSFIIVLQTREHTFQIVLFNTDMINVSTILEMKLCFFFNKEKKTNGKSHWILRKVWAKNGIYFIKLFIILHDFHWKEQNYPANAYHSTQLTFCGKSSVRPHYSMVACAFYYEI